MSPICLRVLANILAVTLIGVDAHLAEAEVDHVRLLFLRAIAPVTER